MGIFIFVAYQRNNYMIVQRLRKELKTDSSIAEKYYGVLSVLNDLGLTSRDVELLAFVATTGNVITKENKKRFCEVYDTTEATVNNIVSKLKKMKLFTKSGKDIQINPVIRLDFVKDVGLDIRLIHG